MQKHTYMFLVVFINIWTILIHDGEFITTHPLISGSAGHAQHHLHFRYNFEPIFTVFDRLWGTYMEPNRDMVDLQYKSSQEPLLDGQGIGTKTGI